MTRARDNQRQRLYDAEQAARLRCPEHSGHQTIANADLQSYVDKVLAHRAVQARWGQRSIQVSLSHGGGRSWGGVITLGTWARNPWAILHEIAHELVAVRYRSVAAHGPEFAGVFLWLVQTFLGKHQADLLREEFRTHRVRKTNKAIPAPTRTVVTQAERRTKQAAAKTRTMLTRVELAQEIRARVALGEFGAAGTKPRTHALATARLIEKASVR